MLAVEPPSGFEPGTLLLWIQHPNHQQQLTFLIPPSLIEFILLEVTHECVVTFADVYMKFIWVKVFWFH